MRRLIFATATTLLAVLSPSAPHPQSGDDVVDGVNTDHTTVAAFAAIRSRWATILNSPDSASDAVDKPSTSKPTDEKTVLQQRLVELTRDLSSQMTTTELQDAVAAAELKTKARRAQQKLDRAAAILKEVADQHPETPAGLAANRAINVLFRPTQELMISEVPEPDLVPTVSFGEAIDFAPGAIQVQHVTPLFAPDARPTWGGISMPLGTPIQPLSDLPLPFQGPDKLDVDSAVPSEVLDEVPSRLRRLNSRHSKLHSSIFDGQPGVAVRVNALQHGPGVPEEDSKK